SDIPTDSNTLLQPPSRSYCRSECAAHLVEVGRLRYLPPYTMLRNVPPESDPGRDTLHGYSAVDRIYAYPGELNADSIASNTLTIPFTENSGFATGWDPLTAWGMTGAFVGWKYQVRYHYQTYEDWDPQAGYDDEMMRWRY